MEYLKTENNKIIYKDCIYDKSTFDKVDDFSTGILLGDNIINFVINDTELNGKVFNNSDEFITELKEALSKL